MNCYVWRRPRAVESKHLHLTSSDRTTHGLLEVVGQAARGDEKRRPSEVLKPIDNIPAITALDRAMILKPAHENSAASRKAEREAAKQSVRYHEVQKAIALARAADEAAKGEKQTAQKKAKEAREKKRDAPENTAARKKAAVAAKQHRSPGHRAPGVRTQGKRSIRLPSRFDSDQDSF